MRTKEDDKRLTSVSESKDTAQASSSEAIEKTKGIARSRETLEKSQLSEKRRQNNLMLPLKTMRISLLLARLLIVWPAS
jgi:hypothetical protein